MVGPSATRGCKDQHCRTYAGTVVAPEILVSQTEHISEVEF